MSNKPDKESIFYAEEMFRKMFGVTMEETDRIPIEWFKQFITSFSASQNSELVERIKKLQSTCLAAAEEIKSKWDAHCDSDGYGPANLIRRLENGVGDWYDGYNSGQFTKLENQNSELKKENEELKQKVSDLTFDNMTYEYNEAEGNEVWPQIEEQIREDEREKLKSIIEEKDNEIERLKG